VWQFSATFPAQPFDSLSPLACFVAEVEDCMGQAGGARAAIDQTWGSPKMAFHENVREMLQRRMRFRRF